MANYTAHAHIFKQTCSGEKITLGPFLFFFFFDATAAPNWIDYLVNTSQVQSESGRCLRSLLMCAASAKIVPQQFHRNENSNSSACNRRRKQAECRKCVALRGCRKHNVKPSTSCSFCAVLRVSLQARSPSHTRAFQARQIVNTRRNEKCAVVAREFYVFCVCGSSQRSVYLSVIGERLPSTSFRSDDTINTDNLYCLAIAVIRHVQLRVSCFSGCDERCDCATSDPSERSCACCYDEMQIKVCMRDVPQWCQA